MYNRYILIFNMSHIISKIQERNIEFKIFENKFKNYYTCHVYQRAFHNFIEVIKVFNCNYL